MKQLLIVFLLLGSLPAQAFTLAAGSNVSGYETNNLRFRLNPDNCPADLRDDIQAGLDLWNSAPTSGLKLSMGDDSATPVSSFRLVGFSETVLIGCSTDFGNDSADFDGNNGCSSASCLDSVFGVGIAYTFNGRNLEKGYLILNMNAGVGGNFGEQSAVVRKITLAHEMGHVLGLGHSGKTSALMYFNVAMKSAVNLSQDDIDGVTYLYPREEFTDGPLGCGSIVGVGSTPPLSSLFMLIPALWLFWLRRRFLTGTPLPTTR